MISRKFLNKVDTCVIGHCGSKTKLNACQSKRDNGVSVNKIEFGIKSKEVGDQKTRYTIIPPLRKRYGFIRLFQQINTNQKKIELHNISIHLKFTSYHNKSRQSRIRISSSIDNETNKLQYTNITPMLDTIILKLFIVEICFKDAAKDKNMAIGDIIIDAANINDIQFREYINLVLATEIEIPCDGCEFQEYKAILCLNLNKLNVCKLENNENDTILFDKGNYAFVIFVDYFDWMYKFKFERIVDFKLLNWAWKPDFSGGDTLDNLECCYQKYIYKPNLFDTDSEYYNYLLINIAKLNSQTENYDYKRLKEKIKNTFDLNLLKTGGQIDNKIENSLTLTTTQKDNLQKKWLEQERIVQRYNNLQDNINDETQITIDTILPNNLKEQLNNIRKEHLSLLLYNQKYNEFVEQIHNKTDLEKLKNECIRKINESDFTEDDKQSLHEIQEEYWYREIQRSKNLLEPQCVELNILRDETLKKLSNKYYDELEEEILKIDSDTILQDRARIDNKI
ncbi:9940_t:CDS:2 [Dentiscutata erythropus]|uniref:9940_t:CDS:1 n=1 Tax=Dentiscutata erythropus TaxID=1348616 RepID=A0A9N9JHW8_9GLOM|nr:9940_t:CDS:2 [Dentiscutata erythropus]